MSSASSLVDYLNAHHPGADMVAQVCVNLVRSWSGGKDAQETYSELMQNAKDPAGVDQMLYQLEGDPAYADNVALIVISSAWGYSELESEIRQLVVDAEQSPEQFPSSWVARAALYGMYLMARNGASADDIAFRNAQGKIEAHTFGRDVPASALFAAMRDQYEDAL
ncbi:MAG: hypothetical protein IPK16_25470 [Anaerolineales bacterium]|nr:hypothetical protein [Anaerolineales bacterium]